MRFSIVCACLLLQAFNSYAQLKEHFDYTHIDNAVIWKGTDTVWQIQNGQLQSNARQVNKTFYISTPSSLSLNCSWEWWMRFDFNTSSLNYADIYLTADAADLTAKNVKGYFVRIGNTKDEVCLYRKDTTAVMIIDGRDNVTNHSSNVLKIKVTRNEEDEWSLYTNEVEEGSIRDTIYKTSAYTGILIRQSTASFFEKHFFDDLLIAPLSKDTEPPPVDTIYDIVINEILYDPVTGTPEFVEIYNKGTQTVNMQQLYCSRSSEDTRVAFSKQPLLLSPGEYAAFTTDPAALCKQYHCLQPDRIYKMNLPALINKEGDIIIWLYNGQLIDSLHYSDKMHFQLADNTKGVSLERVDETNWHSAASTAGYGTPGYANSQLLELPPFSGTVKVSPDIFSPDNDGIDDMAVIRYELPGPGYVANITIFDALGRPVRYLSRNILLSVKGQIIWDGVGTSNKILTTGVYIVFIEMFDLKGYVRRWKLPITLGRRNN